MPNALPRPQPERAVAVGLASLAVVSSAMAATKPTAPPRVPGAEQVKSTHARERHEGHRLDRSRHPERRALQLGARGQPQRGPGHHRARALLRAHDVQRHQQARAGRVRPPHGGAGRLQQRLHQRRRHRLPGLVPAQRARSDVRPGVRPARQPVLRPQGHRERARRRLFRAAPARSRTTTPASSSSRCRPPPSSRTRTRFRPSAGRPTSRAGRSRTCRSSSRPTTRPTTARWSSSGDVERGGGLRAREEVSRAHSAAGAAAAGAHDASPSSSARGACSWSATRRRRCCTTPTSRRPRTIRRARRSTC